jgi:hypothetical protein
MRILTFWNRTIWRIGSLQSRISIPSADVIRDAVTVSDGVSRLGECASWDSEGGDRRGSSKHHRLGIPSMAAPTTLSLSSLPQTSNNVSERVKKKT